MAIASFSHAKSHRKEKKDFLEKIIFEKDAK